MSDVFPCDMNVKEEVLARLMGKGIICPDCHKVCKDLLVERFEHRLFRVDLQTKKLIPNPEYPDWEYNDHAYHCPNCDSLNIDSIVREANLELDY
jgi:ssDNA-binding Zn-finger/Zn-ribbon topoisomerase 1